MNNSLLFVLLVTSTGCVHYTRAEADAGDTFDALWQRKLSHFEQAIAVEKHTGADDDWTRVAEAWLDFTTCRDFDPPDEQGIRDAGAKFALAALYAEDVRRRLEVVAAATERRRIESELLGVDVTRPGFFDREAGPVGPDYIEWPAAEEDWADESPTRVTVSGDCTSFVSRVLVQRVDPEDEDSPRRGYEDWLAAYFSSVENVRIAHGELPSDLASGAPAAASWNARFHAADLAWQTAEAWREFGTRAQRRAEKGRDAEKSREVAQQAATRTSELEAHARAELERLVKDIPPAVDSADAARAQLLLADVQIRANRPSEALELLAAARESGLDEANIWSARYLELRLAARAARWEDAASLADELPPPDSNVHGAYFYRTAVALKRTGDIDRFLNVAMQGFRDREYRADPFLRALYWELMQTLAEYPFEERVIEILEEMGKRGGTFERTEEYARVALDRARPENASAAARWLLARHTDARFHPRYYGILALAAFLEDDEDAFRDALANVVRRPSALVDALPQHRRSTFFAPADTELARILRQMLPVMVEWGDGRAARDRRQRWLKIIVGYAQEFMRNTKDTLARPQLVELYRLASALLDEHPRGYAERIGESEPAPLVLGTVRVEGRDLEEYEPRVELQMPTPYSLTVIPRSGLAMADWPMRWPDEEAEEGAE